MKNRVFAALPLLFVFALLAFMCPQSRASENANLKKLFASSNLVVVGKVISPPRTQTMGFVSAGYGHFSLTFHITQILRGNTPRSKTIGVEIVRRFPEGKLKAVRADKAIILFLQPRGKQWYFLGAQLSTPSRLKTMRVWQAQMIQDREIKALAARSNLIVTGRVVSKPQESNFGSESSTQFYFGFQASQILKGKTPIQKPLRVRMGWLPKHIKRIQFRPPPVEVGAPYIAFFHDDGPLQGSRWQIIGLRPYRPQLAAKARAATP